MIRAFYSARAGLNAHQNHLNTIANNIANTNTVGFKPMRSAFTDLVYRNLNRDEVENEVLVGHGVKINKNDAMMAQGPLQMTEFPLDFALLDENAFFVLEDSNGELVYTRAGNFRLSNEDDTFYLVSGAGYRVLDEDGAVIEIEFDDNDDIDFDPTTLGVVSFPNYYGLNLAGENNFVETDASGAPEQIEEPRIKIGFLEGSGTELAYEMANVIEASKAFSFSSRMLQVADEVEQTVNALR